MDVALEWPKEAWENVTNPFVRAGILSILVFVLLISVVGSMGAAGYSEKVRKHRGIIWT